MIGRIGYEPCRTVAADGTMVRVAILVGTLLLAGCVSAGGDGEKRFGGGYAGISAGGASR